MTARTCFGIILVTLGLCAPVLAQDASEPETVAQILELMDRQMTFESRSSVARMLIITPEETREKQFRSFARGQEDAFMVFEKPRRDAGTKFLKLGGNLWIYFPRTEKTVKISGHLLRQSMLGSDFSYEDLTENRAMLDDYDGEILPDEEIDGQPCYVIHLKEKERGMSYPERKYWISKDAHLPVREERYAKSGRLLKVARFEDARQFEDRRFPTRIIMEDKLKEGSRTEIVLDELKFRIDEPEGIFDRRNLRREIRF
ncbi:MAG: outer membrane lipoprotein-sorting protein [bacterium]|nr:outer membrane lipoprotein-sorting protein [bacterium]